MSLLMVTSKLQAHVCMCVCMLYACVYARAFMCRCVHVCVRMGLCMYMHVAAVGWGIHVPLEIKGQPWLSFLSEHLPSFTTMFLIGQELINK